MTIRETCLKIMNDEVFDKPIPQTHIIKRMVSMTGKTYESCRGNSFRNPLNVPEIHSLYTKVIVDNRVCYVRGESNYKHNYTKPEKYYELLRYLNESDRIWTLSGTDSNCSKVLDPTKTIRVDRMSHADFDIKKDIYQIKESGSYNLDFEGYLSDRRINYINSLTKSEYILLTYRSSKKRNHLLKEINFDLIDGFTYLGKNNISMRCVLFHNFNRY